MSKEPVRLGDVHVAILMRLHGLSKSGRTEVSVLHLVEEFRSRQTLPEVLIMLREMAGVGLISLEETQTAAHVMLLRDGFEQAQKWLDALALTEPGLALQTTTVGRFLDRFHLAGRGSDKRPSGWQWLKLQAQWMFRGKWN